ncbi:DUF3231 family protein [Pseudalkalibacillus sp. A8]|uniref:DUF3231 family protein n=1 Tax=Pseudalkalibacillus sp. A8 TaxID=3382641 RepID=UPI0038B484B3
MEYDHQTRLTSAEMATLWGQYVTETATRCVLQYFSATVENPDIRSIIEAALDATVENIKFLSGLFEMEDFPIPKGFTEDDVNLETPRLFSDLYFILNLKDMTIVQMSSQTLGIGLGSRSDVIGFHETLLYKNVRLQEKIKDVLLQKGLYIRPPYFSVPDQVEFVTDQSFLGNLIGKQRPFTAVEISHLFLTTESNILGKETQLGFAQAAKSEKVKNYFYRGKEIANKHIKILKQVLIQDDLPATMPWDSAVTASTVPPFSDKLMMYLVSVLSATGIAKYGAAMGASPRKDIALKYARFLSEISLYAEDGANIMIENGWLEEPPHAPDHDKLIKD